MRHKRLKISTVLLLGLGLTTLQAQEAVTATGGDAFGSGGSASYSIGQVAYQTHTGTSGSVAEGVQQPYEISTVTGIDEAKGINLSVSAYPNPTIDFLQLKVENEELKGLFYQLYDMQGQLLQNEKITSNQTSIVMSSFLPSTYFVKVIVKTQGIASQQEVKTFKIIKTQ
jgi:hypothetical protein